MGGTAGKRPHLTHTHPERSSRPLTHRKQREFCSGSYTIHSQVYFTQAAKQTQIYTVRFQVCIDIAQLQLEFNYKYSIEMWKCSVEV